MGDNIAPVFLELSARMGAALLRIQNAEGVIKNCTTYFTPEAGVTWAMMQSEEAAERKKTLGYFLKKLREKLDVDPTFADLLSSFLDNRNTFIHHFQSVPGFNLDTIEGLQIGLAFVKELTRQAEHVTHVVHGFIRNVGGALGFEGEAAEKIDIGNPEDFYKILALMALRPKT
jgi:hypothetical protein